MLQIQEILEWNLDGKQVEQYRKFVELALKKKKCKENNYKCKDCDCQI